VALIDGRGRPQRMPLAVRTALGHSEAAKAIFSISKNG